MRNPPYLEKERFISKGNDTRLPGREGMFSTLALSLLRSTVDDRLVVETLSEFSYHA